MKIAFLVSTRSQCLRKRVGAVIVKDNRILTTGYNGTPPGLLNCTPETCLNLPPNERCSTMHAEQNAIGHSALHGISLKDATIYITAFPCEECFRILQASGVRHVVYAERYKFHRSESFLYKNTYISIREFYPEVVQTFERYLFSEKDLAPPEENPNPNS